ncbi:MULTISPECIES: ATP-binding protein [unclassified Roseofilum]|uniref:hybrid sensor histidine kinase/response regulator n=1 Tax=unclassified Roseofilum TaxID=2620099 RepID=UPI001B1DC11D|nr:MULTISPECIES: ATP-binding protein [unclassified Roseofilum]MBP0008402.1 response regulator [Roseofilum sp. Belize Diploria]MBP0015782.1 response regulator [Roseofilum sp. SID3]MBP0033300.1 response regulator [Roseofilum sp. Belize BBD 4]MBP0036574.1 response regulator [Roseofilum sp. SID1]MBP0042002.1 response regulator [Roseofilum sp. SBFL]
MDLQRLQEEQELILSQMDNAIALFDASHHLVLFNQKLAQLWEVELEYLQKQPHIETVISHLIHQGYWSPGECQELKSRIIGSAKTDVVIEVEQSNGIHLEISTTATSNQGRLLIFRDVTRDRQALKQAALMEESLNAEVKRLRFLLGLNERLQTPVSLKDMGQYALNYLIETMDSAFGDIKVISGEGEERLAGPLTNNISGQFIASCGKPVVEEMESLLQKGIPQGQGLLWEVVRTGEPLFIENYCNHPQSLEIFRHPNIGQLGIFPIPTSDGRVIGVLTLESRNIHRLEKSPQQDMLIAACRTLGVAIERASAQETLHQINQDLERASQLKSEFLASMSHELRTPLNSILGFSDLLLRQRSGQLNERQQNQVKAIASSGKHLLSLINEILDLSKIEAGKSELDLQILGIHELCTDCLKMIQPRADKKRQILSLELDYRLDQALLDERRIRQILVNLLSNAVKFTPEKGQIKLKGRLAYGEELAQENRCDRSPINQSTPYLCLEVQDTGIGVPKDQQHLLFRPFQQIDSSLTRRHEGTGLGLSLTKRLAELHGGTLSFESQEGKGSVFRVWLPLTGMSRLSAKDMDANQEGPPIGDPPKEVNGKRVLVVEDQPYNQALISEILELEGYSVELIADGQVMVNTIESPLVTQQNLPALILMDVQLPEVDGLELVQRLKANPLWKEVPVIIVTAMAMAGDREQCMKAGADGYLSKPLDFEDVVEVIQQVQHKTE